MATRKTAVTASTGTRTARTAKAPKRPSLAAAKRVATSVAPDAGSSTRALAASKPKHKLVRDSFTIPKGEYAALSDLKQRAVRLARPARKSELLRACIAALSAMSDKAFLAAVAAVPSLKTGRPKNEAVAPTRTPAKKR